MMRVWEILSIAVAAAGVIVGTCLLLAARADSRIEKPPLHPEEN